jgi:hypothetical protein
MCPDTSTTTADMNGPLAAPVQGATVNFNFAGGAQAAQTINFNFGTPRQILSNGAWLTDKSLRLKSVGCIEFAALAWGCSTPLIPQALFFS